MKQCVKCGQPGEFYEYRNKCKKCISEERKEKKHPKITAEKRRIYRFNHTVNTSKKQFSSKESITTGGLISFLVRHHKMGDRYTDFSKAIVDNVRDILVE